MPAKRDVLINPVVSEFVYDCIVRATDDQKRKLNGKYIKAVKSSRTAKAFVAKSTQEEKAIMLSKLGVPFAWTFNLTKKKLNELFENRKDIKPSQLSDIMLKEKIIVVTDKQIVQQLGLMSANCHSEVWMMNRDFLKAGFIAREWQNEYKNTTISDVKDGGMIAKRMAKIIVNTIVYGRYSESVYGMPESSLSVLLFMFSKDKEFITEEEIRIHFNNIYRGFKLGKSINDLLKAVFIERGYISEEKEYRVTTTGVDAVLKFQAKIFEMSNF